jgi:predicted ATPase/DNA-binding winged helix-turn-helix (wHTH) protein
VFEQGLNLVYECGQWQVHLERRELLASGVAVPIGARAFEIIEILARSANALVTKSDLMDRIWPGATVGENTLQVHISAIRKAFGQDRDMLKTASGRGYRLLGNWTPQQQGPAAQPVASPLMREPGAAPANHFPMIAGRLIGRAAAVQQVRDLVSAYRVVTLTGPGGIGKTSLAIEACRDLLADFDGGGAFVELASLSNPDLVASAVASALGLKLSGEMSADSVARAVGAKRLLLVLDNCEHVIDAAAHLAERFTRLCPHTTTLVTSREVLRIDSETVYRVPPLDVPALGQETQDNILGHSAVELFIARTNAQDAGVSPRTEDLASVAAICRRLDGIPLAIELAAASAAGLGIAQVALGLRDRFALLTRGRRTALARQKTLRATLDWSHELLPEAERLLFRRLAVFSAGFTVDAAAAVMTHTGLDAGAVTDGIASLVMKSLVVLDATQGATRWQLLETIRAYALAKLDESGEREQIAQRHAEYCLGFLENTHTGKETSPTTEFLTAATPLIDDIRAALNWAFSPTGDANIAIDLTTATIPLWTHLSLNDECRRHVELALSHAQIGADVDIHRDMKLFAALGATLIYTDGPGPKANEAWENSLNCAERLGNTDYQLRALWGLFQVRFNTGGFRSALNVAEQLRRLAASSTDPADTLLGDRLVGLAHFYLGDHISGRRHIASMLDGYSNLIKDTHIVRFQFDQTIVAKTILARMLWALGQPDEAMRKVRDLVEDAKSNNHAMSLSLGLAQAACPITLWRGDFAAAESFIRLLVEHTDKHGLDLWNSWGHCFEGMLLIARGDHQPGLRALRAAMNKLPQHNMRYGGTYAYLAEAMGATRDVSGGLSVIQDAIGQSEQDEERWHIAEFLRIKGELSLLQNGPSAVEAAEESFQQSLNWARRQGVLSWELRAAMSLARLRMKQMRTAEARELAASTLERFKEGFDTADLVAAKNFVDRLS